MRESIVVIGGSGYIGKHLVSTLSNNQNCVVKVLSRNVGTNVDGWAWPSGVEVFQGDLNSPLSLDGLFERGCTVVNLSYFWEAGEQANLQVIENILRACQKVGVKRLIHFSTAAVSGRVPDDVIDESTDCIPLTEYGRTKLKIEKLILHNGFYFDRVVLRPTAVYGPGGAPLQKLANDLLNGSRVRNYLKSCLFGRRRMNLVHVANVVDATVFLISDQQKLGGQIFIISDDDAPENNFEQTERILTQALGGLQYPISPVRFPLGLLSLLLRFLGRNNINPACNYSQKKLEARGFVRRVEFSKGLQEYAHWYGTCHSIGSAQEVR